MEGGLPSAAKGRGESVWALAAWAAVLVALIAAGAPASAAGSHGRSTSSASKLRRAATFLAPRALGVECGVVDEPGVFVGVNCQSVKAPPLYEQKATLDANGHDVFCHDLGDNHCNLGNRGENPIKTLGFGRQIKVGRFRCQVQHSGLTCTVSSTGKGFFMNRDKLTPVGGATVSTPPLDLMEFRSPDRVIGCIINESIPPHYDLFCQALSGHAREATMGADGAVTVCNEPVLDGRFCSLGFPSGPILAYGERTEAQGFRCTSAPDGITCIKAAGAGKGKGFRINTNEAVAVG